jgi:hypothetical protein
MLCPMRVWKASVSSVSARSLLSAVLWMALLPRPIE